MNTHNFSLYILSKDVGQIYKAFGPLSKLILCSYTIKHMSIYDIINQINHSLMFYFTFLATGGASVPKIASVPQIAIRHITHYTFLLF